MGNKWDLDHVCRKKQYSRVKGGTYVLRMSYLIFYDPCPIFEMVVVGGILREVRIEIKAKDPYTKVELTQES